jgi:Ca-activated chloride channel family protein
MVAVDVSTSMLARDVEPDRLNSAKDAARRFVDGLPDEFNVGLVAFAGSAAVLVPPGTDREALHEGIERLVEGATGVQGTAIGEAINTSLGAVKGFDGQAAENPPPARVIVLSDGANTSGMDPMEAAADAVEMKVPVHTISFGTPSGFVDRGGRPIQVPVDGQTLRAVAEETGGLFHEASTSDELQQVYEDIGSSVGYRTVRQDVSARFIGLGLMFAMGAAFGSLRWFSRLP